MHLSVYMNVYIKNAHRHTHIHLEIMTGETLPPTGKKKDRSTFSTRLLLLRTKCLISKLHLYFALIYQSKKEGNARTQIKDLESIHLVTIFSTSVE